ncbi:MAG: response regulator [Dokdonia sp.]|jgi:signal transduction histidine kinase/ActR/RegA family two-component response regulator|nr:hybrid sensor histidine kinase/response regulator [Cytophagaceae bacterium]
MMRFKFICGLVFLFLTSMVKAQENTVVKDSLEYYAQLAASNLYEYNTTEAIKYSSKLISMAEAGGYDYYQFEGYNLLGDVYTNIKDTLLARQSYEKGLEIAKDMQVDSLLSWAYISLGNVESDGKANYQKGIRYYQKSIAINDKLNRQRENATPYINIAWTYLDEGLPDLAYPYLLKAKRLSDQSPIDNEFTVAIKTLLGRYYLSKGNYVLAEEQLSTAAQLADAQQLYTEGAEVYQYFAQLKELQNDYQTALAYYKKYTAYEKRVYESDKLSEIQAASAKLNLKQIERDLQAAKKEQLISDQLVEKSSELNLIFIISSVVLLVALITLILAFKSRRDLVKRLRERNHELQVAKEKAEHLSKMKTQFFSTVSHELRTPLYGVIGIASILLEEKAIKTHQEDLQSLKFSADYLLALINDVLLLNKMDANGVRLEHTPFRLSTLTKSITRSFEFSLEQNKNTIHLEIDEQVPNKLVGDSVRISQILMNLIGNAIKFNENGNIWVSIKLVEKTKEGYYRTKFTVKDDGIGIPKSKQKTIFEEFSQVENRNYNYQGTGLGLPIVKKLLALYDSEIMLESSIGEGSTFSFIINLESNQGSDLDREETKDLAIGEGHTIHSLKNIHILVVDDNRINQKITQKILEKRQFQCSLADDGAQAIAMVKTNTYDLILMDIHMPKIDGIQATLQIREFNTTTPIVALTAVELDEMRATIIESGMDDIILKPYDVSQFLTTILRNINKANLANE